METRVVTPVSRLRTKTSRTPLVSSPTSVDEPETKATRLPSADVEIPSCAVVSLAGAPAVVAVTNAGETAAIALVAVTAMLAARHPHASRPHARRTEDLPVLVVPAIDPGECPRKPALVCSGWRPAAGPATPRAGVFPSPEDGG